MWHQSLASRGRQDVFVLISDIFMHSLNLKPSSQQTGGIVTVPWSCPFAFHGCRLQLSVRSG